MVEHADRRVRRTRANLHRALIELMVERDYDRISVREASSYETGHSRSSTVEI